MVPKPRLVELQGQVSARPAAARASSVRAAGHREGSVCEMSRPGGRFQCVFSKQVSVTFNATGKDVTFF